WWKGRMDFGANENCKRFLEVRKRMGSSVGRASEMLSMGGEFRMGLDEANWLLRGCGHCGMVGQAEM
ncbi:hypothetical protein A2U01_0074686, partial [Trifolium medium]|nr:hypothetical protein [Trifolium medium]